MLKNIEQKKALEYFIKLKESIAAMAIRTKETKAFNVTVSIGVAFNDASSLDEILKQADTALYHAKKNGKNRVEVG